MSRITFHAGMGKAGSTALQAWLRDEGQRLHDDAGVTTLTGEVDHDGRVTVARHTTGSMNSYTIMGHCHAHPEDAPRVLDDFFAQLDSAARRHGWVVLSSETFARPIAHGDEDLVSRLDDLGSRHEVRVAYYSRPQHSAIESGWKHWRSTREKVPSEFIARVEQELYHFRTLTFVRRVAPRVVFDVRPCRSDLLHQGNVVSDFARVFLDLDAGETGHRRRENVGVPLDIANALTFMPAPHPWPAHRDRVVLDVVKDAVAGSEVPPSSRAALSKLVLQQACHDRFEEENRALIDALGWETDAWVPAVPDDIGEVSFARMDELWRPDANAAELDLLQQLLAALVETRHELDTLRSRRSVRGALAVSRLLHR